MIEFIKKPFNILISAVVILFLVVGGILFSEGMKKEKEMGSSALKDKDNNSNFNPQIIKEEYDPEKISVDETTVTLGNQDAQTTVTIFEDFSCPACKMNEKEIRNVVNDYIQGDDVKIQYKIVSILDNTDKYSTRTANFMLAVAHEAPAQWGTLHSTLFENQPAHTNQPTGYTDEQLLELGKEVGIKDISAIEKQMKEQTFFKLIAQNTQNAIDNGMQGTPTINLNGKEISYNNSQEFKSAVDAVIEK